LDIPSCDAADGGFGDTGDLQSVDVGSVAIEGDVFDGEGGEGTQYFLRRGGVERGAVGVMQGGGDGDGVTGDRSDFQDLAAATGGITAGVAAASRRVFSALLQAQVISGCYREAGNRRKAGSQFVGGGAQGDGRAVVGIAVAGAADNQDGTGGGVADDGATAAVDSDIGFVEGELGGG